MYSKKSTLAHFQMLFHTLKSFHDRVRTKIQKLSRISLMKLRIHQSKRWRNKPYSLEVTIVPQKQVNKRVVDSIKDIFDVHSVAGDKINLSQKWKGKMTKIEKLRKCVKMLITQNNENAPNFDIEELIDMDSSFNAVELSTSTDDDNNIGIDFDQL